MAIVIVLSFCTILLILGVSYLQSFSQSTVSSGLQLDHIQSEFFARGVQNIALFKIKRYPDFFLRAYRYQIHHNRILAGEALEPLIVPMPDPSPLQRFVGRYPARPRDILNHITDAENAAIGFTTPLRIATYSTEFSLMSSDDFNRAFIEITVNLQLEGKNVVNSYRKSITASQTAVP